MRKTLGFTLMEMLTVVAIISILAAIAVPAYSKYVLRSRRVEGQILANTIAQAQERHFATYNRYARELTGAGRDTLGFSAARCAAVSSTNCYYDATNVSPDDRRTFTVTLTPKLSQAVDKCGNLTLTDSGDKAFSGNETNGKCW